MSKGIIKTVAMIGSFALMAIPGVGTALGLGGMALLGLTTAQVVGMGLMLASSILLGPKVPKALRTGPTERLHTSFDVSAPRKIVFGETALATDVRYQSYSGTNQEYYHQIVAVASHDVEAINEIWLDNEKAWSVSGGVLGRFVGYLTVVTRPVATSANGIAIDATWTTACTLTGCAYIHIRYKLSGNTDKVQSPFASGVSGRMTIRGKGAKLYDPRLDTTVTGGSGAHRTATQTTWEYATAAESGRNPALQLLFYMLGWDINAKLAVGMGLPSARIDLPSFITGANICDELITLNGGGTEKRYRSDGIFSEGDNRQAVIEHLCQTMNATLRDSGGKITLSVIKNDLATPIASFTEGDIIGEENWEQTPGLSSSVNITRGRYIDASDVSLYQMVDYPEVALASLDGIDRIDSADFPMVQSSPQAQRLAKQRLQRNQYQGVYTAEFGPRAWQVSVGDVVQLSHAGLGWTNKLFRIVDQQINRAGSTKMALLEENAAIYAWDSTESAAVVGGTPTVYDPLNDPLLRPPFGTIIGSDKPEDDATVDANIVGDNPVIIFADSTGTPKAGELSKVLAYKFYRLGAALTTGMTWTATLISGNATFTISGTGTATFTITGPTDSTLAIESVVRLAATYAGVNRELDIKIIRQDDPPTSGAVSGNPGTTASTTTLTNATLTTYPAGESAVITAKAGTAGQVACTAPLNYKRTPGTVAGNTGAFGKWQWRVPAGVWADITTEIADAADARTVDNSPDPIVNFGGSLSVAMTKTGLTSGSDYEFKLLWRKVDVSGDVDNIYRVSGTMQAAGS